MENLKRYRWAAFDPKHNAKLKLDGHMSATGKKVNHISAVLILTDSYIDLKVCNGWKTKDTFYRNSGEEVLTRMYCDINRISRQGR